MASIETTPNFVGALYFWLPFIGVFKSSHLRTTTRVVKFRRLLFQRIYIIVVDLSLLHVIVGSLINAIDDFDAGHFSDLADSLTQMVVYSVSFLTTVYFQLRRRMLYTLLSQMNKNFAERSNQVALTYVSMHNVVKFLHKFAHFYLGLGLVVGQQTVPRTLLAGERQWLLRMWCPTWMMESPIYEMEFVFQMFSQSMLGLSFCQPTLYALTVALVIGAQFDVLFANIRGIEFAMDKALFKKKQMQIPLDTTAFRFAKEYPESLHNVPTKRIGINTRLILSNCIIHHWKIVKSAQNLEAFICPVILYKYMVTSAQICLLMVSIFIIDTQLTTRVLYAQYLMFVCADLFGVSYLGQIMLDQSVRVRDFLYALPWYRMNRESLSIMRFMQMYSLQEVQLTGGKMFVMKYDKFIAVVKMAFTLYTILKEIEI